MTEVAYLMLGWSHRALGLESREGEAVHELLERNAVLEAQRNGDGEAVHQRAEGGALLVHVDEDLAQRAVLVFAGAQVDLLPADARLLGETLGASWAGACAGAGVRRTSAAATAASVGASCLLVEASLRGWVTLEPSR